MPMWPRSARTLPPHKSPTPCTKMRPGHWSICLSRTIPTIIRNIVSTCRFPQVLRVLCICHTPHPPAQTSSAHKGEERLGWEEGPLPGTHRVQADAPVQTSVVGSISWRYHQRGSFPGGGENFPAHSSPISTSIGTGRSQKTGTRYGSWYEEEAAEMEPMGREAVREGGSVVRMCPS